MYDGPLIDEDPKELFTCDGEEWTDHARDLEWVISENLQLILKEAVDDGYDIRHVWHIASNCVEDIMLRLVLDKKFGWGEDEDQGAVV